MLMAMTSTRPSRAVRAVERMVLLKDGHHRGRAGGPDAVPVGCSAVPGGCMYFCSARVRRLGLSAVPRGSPGGAIIVRRLPFDQQRLTAGVFGAIAPDRSVIVGEVEGVSTAPCLRLQVARIGRGQVHPSRHLSRHRYAEPGELGGLVGIVAEQGHLWYLQSVKHLCGHRVIALVLGVAEREVG